MLTKQIIAMGGGGFSMEPDNLLLDRYVLAQTGKPRPRICFLPTASADSLEYVVKFYAAFTPLDCRPSHLMLFNPSTADLESFLLEKDAIYVGGGNTRSMLALWQDWNLPRILHRAWENGTVLAGISAGANCWFEQCVTDSVPGRLTSLLCLGFLPGSFCPHYDGEVNRRPAYQSMVASGELAPGFAADDGVALHFVDDAPAPSVVSSRVSAKAYRVSAQSGVASETAIEARYLGVNPASS